MSGLREVEETRSALVLAYTKPKPRVVDMPGFRKCMSAGADTAAGKLREFGIGIGKLEVICLDQRPSSGDVAANGNVAVAHYVVRAWKQPLIVRAERNLIVAALQAMYGGDFATDPDPLRRWSSMELSIASELCGAIVEGYRIALEDVVPFAIATRQIEGNPARQGPAVDETIMVELGLQGTGQTSVVMQWPRAAFYAAENEFSAEVKVSPSIVDPTWEERFQASLSQTALTIMAVADGPELRLRDVAELSIGSRVVFPSENFQHVRIEIEGIVLFDGHLIKSDGHVAVLIDRICPPSEED